jgi:hypothetical protein
VTRIEVGAVLGDGCAATSEEHATATANPSSAKPGFIDLPTFKHHSCALT